ncbi:hypothetical protein [Mesorhizobium sp. CN2-181]|uniref:hypothetical protein n=1 Tax=Mesorhizobium yinganensis TaxID=3157707 RepID=UPI0032B8530D
MDLQPDEIIEIGARWLVQHRNQIDSGVVDELKRRFGVPAITAVEIIRSANRLRMGGANAP